MLKKIISTTVIVISLNQTLICADQAPRPALSERVSACPRRTVNLCTRMSEQCYDAYQKHPALTPVTAAGLLLAGMSINPVITCPFALGLGVGTLYNRYKAHKD